MKRLKLPKYYNFAAHSHPHFGTCLKVIRYVGFGSGMAFTSREIKEIYRFHLIDKRLGGTICSLQWRIGTNERLRNKHIIFYVPVTAVKGEKPLGLGDILRLIITMGSDLNQFCFVQLWMILMFYEIAQSCHSIGDDSWLCESYGSLRWRRD